MDHAGNFTAVFRLDRHDKPAVRIVMIVSCKYF